MGWGEAAVVKCCAEQQPFFKGRPGSGKAVLSLPRELCSKRTSLSCPLFRNEEEAALLKNCDGSRVAFPAPRECCTDSAMSNTISPYLFDSAFLLYPTFSPPPLNRYSRPPPPPLPIAVETTRKGESAFSLPSPPLGLSNTDGGERSAQRGRKARPFTLASSAWLPQHTSFPMAYGTHAVISGKQHMRREAIDMLIPYPRPPFQAVRGGNQHPLALALLYGMKLVGWGVCLSVCVYCMYTWMRWGFPTHKQASSVGREQRAKL